MRTLFIALFLAFLAPPAPSAAADAGRPAQRGGQDERISEAYLARARAFRNDGRYELARQAYVKALASCANEATLETIKRELDAIELIIRTMR